MVAANKAAAEEELNHQPHLQGGEADMWLKKLRDMSGEVASADPSEYLPLDVNKVCNFIIFLSLQFKDPVKDCMDTKSEKTKTKHECQRKDATGK